MDNNMILKKIIDVLKNSTQYNISIENSMIFLLGNKYESQEEIALSPSQLYNIAIGKEMPSQTILALLANSDDWTTERLWPFYCRVSDDLTVDQAQKFTEEITVLYNQYFPTQPPNNDFSKMIESLIRLYFFNSTEEILFKKYTQAVCPHYIPWLQKTRSLKSLIQCENIIYINGLPGTGKKQLVSYFISQEQYNPYNVAWINITSADLGIKEALAKTDLFLTTQKLSLEDKLSLLKEKGDHALLLINVPYIKSEDFSFIDQYLIPTRIKCIIITRSNCIGKNRTVLNLDRWPVSILKKIFQSLFSYKFFTEKEFNLFCSKICFNPLAVSLVAKMLQNAIKNKTKEESEQLKKMLIDYKTWIWKETNLPKIHSPYKSSGTKTGVYITAILKRMLNDLPDSVLSNGMSEIALWCRYPILLKYLQKICKKGAIESALNYNLLQFYDSEKAFVSMPSLIAEIILDRKPLYFSDYEFALRNVLCRISVGETLPSDFSSIYQTILNVIYYFQPNTTMLKTRPSEPDYAAYNKWNTFLLDIISYFCALGNTVMANELINDLYLATDYKKAKNEIMNSIQELKKRALFLTLQCTKGVHPSTILQDINELQNKLGLFRCKKLNLTKYTYLDFYILEQQMNNIFGIALEQIIVLEHEYTDNMIVSRQPLTPSNSYIITLLKNINIVEHYHINTNYDVNATYYYRMMITYYILALYNQPNVDYITCADNYYRCVVNHQMISSELKFRASIHRMHYILVWNYVNYIYYGLPITYEKYRTFSFQYGQLYRHYNGRIHNNISMQAFYCVTAYYINLLVIPCPFKTCSYYTLYMIKQVIKDYDNFVLKQSTVSTDEQKEVLKLFQDTEFLLKTLSIPYETDSIDDLPFYPVFDYMDSTYLTDIWIS